MEERKPDLSWIDKAPEARRAGKLLAAYRVRLGISRMVLERKLGIWEGGISSWENGDRRIDVSYLAAINHALELSPSEAQCLLYARLPALNPNWLTTQPEHRRAGALLFAYRTRCGIAQIALARKLGLPDIRINIWENSNRRIDASYLEAISRELELSQSDAQNLLYARLPALNPDWLNHQPEYIKAGMLLRAYRELKGFSGRELAQELCRLAGETTGKKNLGTTVIHSWEYGEQAIATKWHQALVTALSLEDEHASDFLKHIQLSAPEIAKNNSAKWATYRETRTLRERLDDERKNPPTREK